MLPSPVSSGATLAVARPFSPSLSGTGLYLPPWQQPQVLEVEPPQVIQPVSPPPAIMGRTISDLLAEQTGAQRAIYPGGVDVILAILGLGATNDAQRALLERFGSEENMLRYVSKIAQLDASPEVKSKNALFFDQEYSNLLNEFYLRLKDDVYMAQSDFKQNELSAQRINRWIEENSGFRNVISPTKLYDPDFQDKAIMVVFNTLWFKDNWTTKFLPSNTQPEPFTKLDGSRVDLPTMQRTGRIQYFVQDNVVGVRLSFEHGAKAEFVMGLPSNSDFNETYIYGTQKEVELHLPKFEHKEKIELNDILIAGGYGSIFESKEREGNLERIIADPMLAVSEVKQLIYVRFDEEGAEVRAVTYGGGLTLPSVTMFEPEKVIIKFDEPFHYRIVKNGITLVNGYYNGEPIEPM